MDYIKLVEVIKSCLEEQGLNQAELAEKSGLSPSQVSRILKMESTPSQEAIVSISRALKLPADVLFRAAGLLPQSSIDPWAEKMIYRISQLSGSRRNLAEKLIDSLLVEEENDKK